MSTSAEIAARFVARREKSAARRHRAARNLGGFWRDGQWCQRTAVKPTPRAPIPARRIAIDLAETTLRLIHDVLLDALHAGIDFSDRGALLMIAEQMVAAALGMPPCDDPPLTDREVR